MSSIFLCFVICLCLFCCLCLDNCLCLCHFSYLLTVVFLVFVFSDVLKLLVFWSPPCPRCKRREPSGQLFRSSLYNSWQSGSWWILYFISFWEKQQLGFMFILSGLLNILCGADGPALQKGMEYISRRHVWWNISQNILVKCISKYPPQFSNLSGVSEFMYIL